MKIDRPLRRQRIISSLQEHLFFFPPRSHLVMNKDKEKMQEILVKLKQTVSVSKTLQLQKEFLLSKHLVAIKYFPQITWHHWVIFTSSFDRGDIRIGGERSFGCRGAGLQICFEHNQPEQNPSAEHHANLRHSKDKHLRQLWSLQERYCALLGFLRSVTDVWRPTAHWKCPVKNIKSTYVIFHPDVHFSLKLCKLPIKRVFQM